MVFLESALALMVKGAQVYSGSFNLEASAVVDDFCDSRSGEHARTFRVAAVALWCAAASVGASPFRHIAKLFGNRCI